MRILAVLTIYLLSTAAVRAAEATLHDQFFKGNLTLALTSPHNLFATFFAFCSAHGYPLESFTEPLDEYETNMCDLLRCFKVGFSFFNTLESLDVTYFIFDLLSREYDEPNFTDGICGGFKMLLTNPEAKSTPTIHVESCISNAESNFSQ